MTWFSDAAAILGAKLFPGVAPNSGRAPLHSDRAVFDDALLGLHAATLAELAWSRLHHAAPEG